MLIKIFAAAIFGLTVFDTYLTRRRIKDYGIEVEINPGIRYLSTLFGSEISTLLLLLIPSLLWIYLGIQFNLVGFLGFLAGFKLRFFYNQLESLAFEKEAKAIQKLINLRSRALPSQSKSEQDSDPSQTGPTNSEE